MCSYCGRCIAPLLPAREEGRVSPLTITEEDLALQFLGNKPFPPLKLVLGWVFFNFKCTSRKPSFAAIIAELITLWRLQTCVISIFPSSHLDRRLENASMVRVNLAPAQPSPLSPATLLQTLPVLVLSSTSQVLLSCRDTPMPFLLSPQLLPSLQPLGIGNFVPRGGCGAWPGWLGTDLAGAAVTCANDPPKKPETV